MERPLFFTHRGARLYGVLHLPDREVPTRRAGFVLCLPLHDEGVRAYRALVEFARELARRGFAALLFDYRGCGESEGEFEEVSVGTCVEDIHAAAGLLANEAGLDDCGLLGVRLGGTAAAIAAAAPGSVGRISRLVLWSPVADTRAYFRDLLRGRLFTEFCTIGRAESTLQGLTADLEAGEAVDVQGYRVGRRLYQECVLADLLEGIGSYRGEVLILDLITKTGRDKSLPRLWQVISAANTRVAFQTMEGFPFWEIPRVAPPASLYEATFRWLETFANATLTSTLSLAERGGRKEVPVPPSQRSPLPLGERERVRGKQAMASAVDHAERPVTIGCQERRLFGILQSPDRETGEEKREGIVFIGGGLYRRSGLHRIFVAAGRAFARAGYVTLRFDLPGLGDSEGIFQNFRNGEEERYNVDEARAAIDRLFLETGLQEVTLLGHCHGAKTAVLTALTDPRVRRLILWSMPMISVNLGLDRPAAMQESHPAMEAPFEQPLDAFLACKREAFFLYGEKDPALSEFKGFLSRRRLSIDDVHQAIPQWEVHTIPHANHDFTAVGWTEEAIQRSLRWLDVRQQGDGLFVE